MSGTAYGTVVLHVSPEAAAPGSVLGLVQDGDLITLDVPNRKIELLVSPEELQARKPAYREVSSFAKADRGWQKLYIDHVQGADTGADLDFLVGSSGSTVTRESH
jgi:dihydroxyacid dehydratase/phosphogluconate dehydratase